MKKLILLMLSAAMLLTGCSARAQELEESAVVRALAFDRGEKGCSVSAYIAGAEEGSVISAEAGTVAEAFFQLNTRTERRIFLGQLRVAAISAEIRDIEEILLYLYSSDDVRSAAKVLSVDGTAKDILEYRGLYRDPASDIEKTVENAEENANYPAVTLYGCVNSMAADAGCCILPMGEMQEENLCIEKSIVYRKYRILQTLTPEEQAGSAIFCEKERVFLGFMDTGAVLSEIRVERRGAGSYAAQCKYRLISQTRASAAEQQDVLEQRIAEVMGMTYDTARRVGARLPGLEPAAEEAHFSVSAIPAGNDYPLKGGTGE